VHQPRHDGRVDDALALGEPSQCVHEYGDIGHPVFEEIAGVRRHGGDELHRVLGLEVLGEHEDADAGVVLSNCVSGPEAFIGVCGTASGEVSSTSRSRAAASGAAPTTSQPASMSSRVNPSRINIESSATTTLI
jgi:hypothetical protein